MISVRCMMKSVVRAIFSPARLRRTTVSAFVVAVSCLTMSGAAQGERRDDVPLSLMLRIVRAEDRRRWDETLQNLFGDGRASVRRRAALAAGRIGDRRAVEPLVVLLRGDRDESVRAVAAFALGEIESERASGALAQTLNTDAAAVRARALEALGKIAAALAPERAEERERIATLVLEALDAERARGDRAAREVLLLGITAALRTRSRHAPAHLVPLLAHREARVRADAANALARLRARTATASLVALLDDADPDVRANAVRALGAAEDAARVLPIILRLAVEDGDLRVRASAIRVLGTLGDKRAIPPLRDRLRVLLATYKTARQHTARPSETNELLEIGTALGQLSAGEADGDTLALLAELQAGGFPEIEVALARICAVRYVEKAVHALAAVAPSDWQRAAAIAQGLAETASAEESRVRRDAESALREALGRGGLDTRARPALLRAVAAFRPPDLDALLREELRAEDVIVRATAAELLAERPPAAENERALISALGRALGDPINDAALRALDALAKQRTATARAAIESALRAKDHLIRRHAVSLLRHDGDRRDLIGEAETRWTERDLRRAIERRWARARVTTEKGVFVIELLPREAPLTVENFIALARRGFFDGLTFHRVVPNFVVQGGDPRGDGEGGPGYQIRCEINLLAYDRGAVGMALAGKDTGGSQWFVTHSPQPHLDGGYTLFGQVVSGMKTVDETVRGDRILRVEIEESRSRRRNSNSIRSGGLFGRPERQARALHSSRKRLRRTAGV